MKRAFAFAAALTVAAPAPAALAADDALTGIGDAIFSTMGMTFAQMAVIFARNELDVTYETMSADGAGRTLSITGLKLYPFVDWNDQGFCEVSIDRVEVIARSGFVEGALRFDLAGVSVEPDCLPPEPGAMLASIGYDGLTFDVATIEYDYTLGSSALNVAINATMADAATVQADAAFEYFWLATDLSYPGEEPFPIMLLSSAELMIENEGLWERLQPMAGAMLGDLSAAPDMIRAGLSDGLSDGGAKPLSAEARTFIDQASGEVGRFIVDGDRLVLTVAPQESIWIDPDDFENPASLVEILQPEVSAQPLAARALIAPQILAAAFSGGAGLDDETRLAAGRALVTGVGAPRAAAQGRELLAPLAGSGDGEAALLIAQSLADEDPASMDAYAMALVAGASGESAAVAILDAIEAEAPLSAVLAEQASIAGPRAEPVWTGSAAPLRRGAMASASGLGAPRSYANAYFNASLAAAAGDRAAAALRDRLDRRFARSGAEARAAWAATSAEVGADAVSVWVDSGLGAEISAAFGR